MKYWTRFGRKQSWPNQGAILGIGKVYAAFLLCQPATYIMVVVSALLLHVLMTVWYPQFNSGAYCCP